MHRLRLHARHRGRTVAPVLLVVLLGPLFPMPGATAAASQEPAPLVLPEPQRTGGRPLIEVLNERRSQRIFDAGRTVPLQELSNLLWAAFGINRPDGRRTAPSAVNWQEVDIFVVRQEGAYRYDARGHRLEPVVAGDLREATGTQAFVADAPLTLVYVADLAKIQRPSRQEREWYAAIDAGFIAQNVYLYCASAGLATVVRALVDREALGRRLELGPEQQVVVAQTVGYPPRP